MPRSVRDTGSPPGFSGPWRWTSSLVSRGGGGPWALHAVVMEPGSLPCLALADGPLLHALRFIPSKSQDGRRPADAAFREDPHGETLELLRKAGIRFGPRYMNLSHAVLGTSHAGNPCVKVGFKLTAIEVSPDPLGCMVARGAGQRALRTGPHHPICVSGPDVHASFFEIELHSIDSPGFGQTKEMMIEIRLLHEGGAYLSTHCKALRPSAPLSRAIKKRHQDFMDVSQGTNAKLLYRYGRTRETSGRGRMPYRRRAGHQRGGSPPPRSPLSGLSDRQIPDSLTACDQPARSA